LKVLIISRILTTLRIQGRAMTGIDSGFEHNRGENISKGWVPHVPGTGLSDDIRMPPVTEYKLGDEEHHRMDLCRWEDEGGRAFDHCEQEFPESPHPGEAMQDQRNSTSQISAAHTSDKHAHGASQPGQEFTPSTFEEFWPHYLSAHSKSATRAVHYAAPAVGLAFAAGCLFTGNPLLALATPVVIYLPIFCSHWFIEGNSPKTFGNPLWSIRAEARMVYLAASGKLGQELRKYDIGDEG
jgi:hypothetical protein